MVEGPDRTGGSSPADEVEQLRAQLRSVQDELARARTDAAQAKQQPGPPQAVPAKRRLGWRGPVSVLLIVLGCVLAPISVLGVWTANQVSNTDQYVANVAPLIKQPAVQGALTDKISAAVSREINVQGITKQAAKQLSARGLTRLGALVSNFSGSIASGVDGLIHTVVGKIVTRPFVARIWVQGNRIAHTQLVQALSGKSSSLTISNGKVVLGLGPFIDQVKHRLAARGLTIVNSLPPINPTFPLFSAKYLVQARSLYSLLTTLRWVLPILALVLLGLGIYVARRHRRALIGAGLGLAASMLVLGVVLAIGRAIYLNKIPPSVLPADAAAVVFDTIVRFIRQGLRVLLVLGLVVALAGFLTGPSVTAVRTRSGVKKAFGYVRGGGEKAGLSTGPVGEWVYRYRQPLRIAAVAGAVLIFVFWTDPTGLVVALIAVFLLVVLGIIELLGRPPAVMAGGAAGAAGAAGAGEAAGAGDAAGAGGTGGTGVAGGPELATVGAGVAARPGAAPGSVSARPDGPHDVPPQAPSVAAEAERNRTRAAGTPASDRPADTSSGTSPGTSSGTSPGTRPVPRPVPRPAPPLLRAISRHSDFLAAARQESWAAAGLAGRTHDRMA